MPNVAGVATLITGRGCVAPRHYLDFHAEEEINNQWTDYDPGPTVEEAEITKKLRTINLAIGISQK